MDPITIPFRQAGPQQLASQLRDARNYTLGLFECLAREGYDRLSRVPHIATINPPLWEIGLMAWFAEWYILREATSSHPAVSSVIVSHDDESIFRPIPGAELAGHGSFQV
jgi:hypothetical protein